MWECCCSSSYLCLAFGWGREERVEALLLDEVAGQARQAVHGVALAHLHSVTQPVIHVFRSVETPVSIHGPMVGGGVTDLLSAQVEEHVVGGDAEGDLVDPEDGRVGQAPHALPAGAVGVGVGDVEVADALLLEEGRWGAAGDAVGQRGLQGGQVS